MLDADAPPPRPRLAVVLLAVFGVWTVLGTVGFLQLYSSIVDGRHTFTFARAFELSVELAWLKGAVSLPVLWALWRFNRVPRAVALGALVYVALLVGFTAVHMAIRPLVVPIQVIGGGVLNAGYGAQLRTELLSFTLDDVVAFALTVAGFHAWRYAQESRIRIRQQHALRVQLASAELSLLKMQLQPHFLFNTLHTIHGLAAHDAKKAQEMIERLSILLRLSFDHLSSNAVPLGRELDFLDAYLGIEMVRFEDRLRVERSIDAAALDAAVPSLLLQPLVENAIRHGVGKIAAGGAIVIRATRRADRLNLQITNDYRPDLGSSSLAGVGLANSRARLTQMFGDDYALAIETLADRVIVTVDMPFRRVEADS